MPPYVRGVLNNVHIKEARGFWPDELRHLHITHLELEAVFKTVRSFMHNMESKVVRLYCDNQAVVAMHSHFTSRNPELMRRMQRLWLLLDLYDIELQARYIRSKANEWADRLSSLAYDWRGENNWVNPPWDLLDEVAQKIREEKVVAMVVAPYWPSKSWLRELEQLADEVTILPRRRDLFVPRRLGGSQLMGPSKWVAIMFHILPAP
ncbi:hypothetical protein CYMTET_37992 [Cymbomonas tetramitiformis]|uniref:RNase H type-1 domain-containing protein n=1 Tax=Cymbomonas tetramitiformis TaxID=36881 RepID=A0AAE0F5E8_9CHLO|nr:hypothetical protein CYMTET_37992 [Cymbomonas tetramitiformis]